MIDTLGTEALLRQDRPTDPRVRAALTPGGLRLAAQGIVDLDGRAVGRELLARPTDGTPPDLLFELAREQGGEPALSARVIAEATDLAPQLGRLPVSVNLDPALIEPLAPAIRRLVRALPGGLRLELPETLPIEAPLAVVRLARSLGVGLVADDLGAGLPRRAAEIDRLALVAIKLDRESLRAAGRERGAETVLAAYLELALRLAPAVIVEGVEEKRELRLLRRIAAGRPSVYAQGYLFDRPQLLVAPTISDASGPLPGASWPRRR